MNAETGTPTGFYVGQWGTWGWAETIVKLAGIVIAILGFLSTSPDSPLTLAGNPELGALILVALLTVVFVGVIGFRLMQREILSIGFAILQAAGFLALLLVFILI
jgi:hypothetical protein